MIRPTTAIPNPGRRRLFFALLMLVAALASIVALMVPAVAPLSAPSLQEGRVAQRDILAPQDITFESEILTAQQRETAARSVSVVYTSPDTSVARRQLEKLRASLAYITSVRADPYSTPEQRLADLAALENIHLTQEAATSILDLSDSRWQAIQQEAIVVLEQVMRNTIREDRLEEARRNIPTLVSLSLTEEQAAIVVDLVAALVAPNSLYSEPLTETAREQARASVQPVVRTFKAGETVVSRGQVITSQDLEALEQLGLVQPQYTWEDFTSAAILVLLLSVFLVFYLRRNQRLIRDVRGTTLIVALYLAFLLGVRLIVGRQTVIPFIFPLAAYGMIVTVLFRPDVAVISSLPLAILAAYNLPNSLELTLFYITSSLFGILVLGRARRLTSFFWAGAAVAGSGALVVLVFRLPQPVADWIDIATLSGAALLNGIAATSLTVLLQFFLAQFLGMTTALQLMEISRPDHPLLQFVLRNAPGTYQHSLQVANLAEQAAEQIGADNLLTRVGALYHDAGKALNPAFYIENQIPGTHNPHTELEPERSAAIIIQHVLDGLELANRHRLPGRIQDFILEHHGTMLTRYQYVHAVKDAGGDESKVDVERFRYPGPRPRSRETAILMLADGCEARARAERPESDTEMRKLLKDVVQNRISSAQLDETDLTLRDLDVIVDSFSATLRGIYHPRIEYPQLEEDESLSPVDVAESTLPVERPASSDAPTITRSDASSPTADIS